MRREEGGVKARQLVVRDARERDEGKGRERGLERPINAMFTCRPPPQFKEKEH